MIGLPADLTVLVLQQSGIPASPRLLRTWVHRGHISRNHGGYDPVSLVAYAERRLTRRTCDLDGCGRPHKAKGMCIRHYRQHARRSWCDAVASSA